MNGAGHQVWQFDPLCPVRLGGDILTMIFYPSPRAARGPPLHCIRSRRRGTSGTAQRAAPPLTFVDVQTAWHLQRCAMKPCKGLAP